MKTNFKRIGKQSISIVLAVMMMLSTMLVGMVTSNAADTFTKGSTLYLNTTATDLGNERWAAYFFNGNEVGVWATDVTSVSNHLYSLTVPGAYEKVIFARMKGDTAGDNWDNKWNQTGDLYASNAGNNNCYVMEKLDGDNSTGHWEIYADSNTTHKVTANFSNATVKLGDKTLTSGTAVTVDNGKDYTLTVTPNSGYSLSKVMQGSNDLGTSGNYTLAAGTDDVTIDITTENNTFDPSNTVYLRVNTNTYPEKFRVHIWKNSDKIAEWANSPYMTEVADEGNGIKVFAYTPDSGKYLKDYNSIIFRCNNGTGNYNNYTDGNFTGDITGVTLQGKIYDSTSTAPNKWSDYTVQTKYNVNIASDTTKGTVTTTPTSLAAGETFKVTAKPNDGYVLDTVTVKNESNNDIIPPNTDGTYTMPASNVTVTVTFKVADPVPVTLYATPVEGGAAYISSYTDNETDKVVTDDAGDKNLQTVKAKPNTSVTFKAKEVNGYFPMWNVNSIKSTGATFTLDASYVTGTTGVAVYLTYEKIENYNLTIASGEGGSVNYTYDETTGTVVTGATSSAISVASNSTITLNANAVNDYVFSGWEFDNESNVVFATGQNSLSTSITINVVGNVNATATFEKRQGNLSDWKFMLSDSDQGLPNDNTGNCQTNYQVYENNGTYSVTFPVSAILSNNTQYLSFSTDGKNSGLYPNNTTFTVEVDDNFKKYVKETENKEWGGYHFPRVQFQNTDDITNIKVTYNSETQTYIINGTYYTAPSDAHTVYATKGNTRSAGMQYGTTTISLFGDGKIYKTKDNGSYNEYVVGDGNQITVECKVTDAQAKLGYYVYAFVVNGAKVDVIDTGNNVYQTTAPITVSSDLEITPVYYNKQIEADGNYVTIYTNAPKELQDSWGNSISIYSWYDNGGAEMNGSYPGQLMMRDSQGKFGAKVPKYSYYEDENGKYVPNKTQKVLGITNNNYSEFQVVHTKFLTTPETQKNHQTYDYDDFEKLTGLGYDTVQFDIKYFPTATDSNQHLLVDNKTNQPSKPNFINDTATPYENLTNIDGKPVSILGYTNDNAKANNKVGLITGEPLHIISVGNQNVKIGEKTTNEWSTIWYVYDSKGNYITQGLPSDFIPRGEFVDNKFVESENQTDAYNAIKTQKLEYNSAVISYEKEMDATTSTSGLNTGWRIDGRWYYARSTDQVDVKLGIIYKNNAGDKWTVDTPTETSKITGKVTGGSASFDYTDSVGASHTNLASASVERNTIITLNATNGTQYKFIGWGTPEYDADGKVIDYNLTDLNATYTVSTNTKLYAMYEPYDTGSVTIAHSKYTGLNSNNGLGIFSVTAKVVDSNGDEISSQISTQSDGSVKLDKIQNTPDAYIKVTLTTQSYAKSHFLNFYYPEVVSGAYTLKKDPSVDYYDKECPANNPATITYMVKVSDLFVNGKQTVMALNYYSDLKLPEVASNITFNYNPYSTAPTPNPEASKGTGKTTFTLTITDNGGSVVYTSKSDISSLTLKGNAELKEILANLTSHSNDYTITISMKPLADSHCKTGATYRQINTDGAYTYTEASTDDVWAYNKDNNTYSASLSSLFDITTQKFKTNTINLYTDFTAEEISYNVTFKYLGYESREYYNKNGFTQYEIPDEEINLNWWKTYTASGTFCGADIDKYYNSDTKTFKEPFLLKVAPYEDNFVQSITWDLENAACSESNDGLSVEATVFAKYKNDSVTVTANLGDGNPSQTHTVNYASLVTSKNLVGSTTPSANDEYYLFVAPEINANGEKFSYWTIQTDDSNGIEVAKCYTREFNFLAYDNYLITACYGKEDVDASKKGVSATMQFLEYSRNQYDPGRDKVYADFAVSYNYNGKKLCADINNDVVCGVVFVVNSKYSSAADATDKFTVNESVLLEKVKSLNSGNSDKTMGDAKVYNYKLNKKNLDNKNRLEYSWNVNNTENNQNLTILAYSYIYNATTDEYSVSAPQEFKFFNVGNKTYKG